MKRLRQLWGRLGSSFWVLPTFLVLGAGALGVALVEVDYSLDADLERKLPRIFAISAGGAQGMLQAIATSMITVAGVTFSITILILSEASNQYSPRILRNFVRDRSNQIVLGVFLAIFVYCIVVLRAIHDIEEETFVPPIAILGGVLLALVGIGVLIFFIHHIAYSIQASTILQRAAKETLEEVDNLYPEALGAGGEERPYQLPFEVRDDKQWHPVRARQSGYLEVTSAEALLNFAEEQKTVLRLEYQIGEFVVEDTPLVSVYGKHPPSDARSRELLGGISITPYRTIEQDVSFGIRQLVDVALKALSPSINDTTTAIMCIDHLTTVLTRLVQRKMASPYRLKGNHLRVIVRRPSFEDLLNESVEQIRQTATGNVTALNRLVHALNTIVPMTQDPVRLKAIKHQREMVRQTILATVSFQPDRARLLLACDPGEEKRERSAPEAG